VLIKTVESNSSQTAFEFAEVMARTTLQDGANMLARFHSTGRLQTLPMSEIEMTPNTATSIGLDELNKIIADQRGVTIADLAMKDPNALKSGESITEAGSVSNMPKTTDPAVVAEAKAANLQAPDNGVLTDADLAAKYRSDADRLYKEAKVLRAQAEDLVPTTKKKSSAKATT